MARHRLSHITALALSLGIMAACQTPQQTTLPAPEVPTPPAAEAQVSGLDGAWLVQEADGWFFEDRRILFDGDVMWLDGRIRCTRTSAIAEDRAYVCERFDPRRAFKKPQPSIGPRGFRMGLDIVSEDRVRIIDLSSSGQWGNLSLIRPGPLPRELIGQWVVCLNETFTGQVWILEHHTTILTADKVTIGSLKSLPSETEGNIDLFFEGRKYGDRFSLTPNPKGGYKVTDSSGEGAMFRPKSQPQGVSCGGQVRARAIGSLPEGALDSPEATFERFVTAVQTRNVSLLVATASAHFMEKRIRRFLVRWQRDPDDAWASFQEKMGLDVPAKLDMLDKKATLDLMHAHRKTADLDKIAAALIVRDPPSDEGIGGLFFKQEAGGWRVEGY